MPHKHKIVEFMRAKPDYLPPDIRDIYFIEGDIEAIMDCWSAVDAEIACKTLALNIEINRHGDHELCPFCIQSEGHCNLCGYFKNHGICSASHSDYVKVVEALAGKQDNNDGITDYILEIHGKDALERLRLIVSDEMDLKKSA